MGSTRFGLCLLDHLYLFYYITLVLTLTPRPEAALITPVDLRADIVIHINPNLHTEDWHTLVFCKLVLQA